MDSKLVVSISTPLQPFRRQLQWRMRTATGIVLTVLEVMGLTICAVGLAAVTDPRDYAVSSCHRWISYPPSEGTHIFASVPDYRARSDANEAIAFCLSVNAGI